MTRTPFYVAMIVTADIVDAVNRYLERMGYGPGNLSIPIIATNDPDGAAPKGYGCLVQGDRAFRTIVHRKAEELKPKAFVFWSMHPREAKQQALAFIHSKGYRLKPRTE